MDRLNLTESEVKQLAEMLCECKTDLMELWRPIILPGIALDRKIIQEYSNDEDVYDKMYDRFAECHIINSPFFRAALEASREVLKGKAAVMRCREYREEKK